jgi:hypothetical protein
MPRDNFQIIGSIENVKIIAIKHSIRDLKFLERMYGQGRWRKLKGIAKVQLENGRIRLLRFTGTKRTASANAK